MSTLRAGSFMLFGLIVAASVANAGRMRQEFVDGCQSADGRFVVTAKLVGIDPKVPKSGQWRFTWKDNKTGDTHSGDLVGLPASVYFAHIFTAPDGETFAVWNPVSYAPAKTALDGDKFPNGGRINTVKDENWRTHESLAHRLVVYKKTGVIVKSLGLADICMPEELEATSLVFHTFNWLQEYPNLSRPTAPRITYGTYQISPDYTVLEFMIKKSNPEAKSKRLVRIDLVKGEILNPSVALDGKNKIPTRPFIGPDRITQDEQYLWVPSLDPVRVAGRVIRPKE